MGRAGVDSKLSCPVYGAHDLSGFPLQEFQRCAKLFRVQLPQDQRLRGHPICGMGGGGLMTPPRSHSVGHRRDSAPDIAAHGTPPGCRPERHGPGPSPSHNGTGVGRAESADAGLDSAPCCHGRRCALPAHRTDRPGSSRSRERRRSRLPPPPPQTAGWRQAEPARPATDWPPPCR
jgi:hypothetical protein